MQELSPVRIFFTALSLLLCLVFALFIGHDMYAVGAQGPASHKPVAGESMELVQLHTAQYTSKRFYKFVDGGVTCYGVSESLSSLRVSVGLDCVKN